MEQYIDKAAVVAEIERRKKYYENIQMIKPVYKSNIEDLNELLSFLDTLEVKEVDLEEEFDKCCENYIFDDECEVYTAKRFFKLGFKARKGQ